MTVMMSALCLTPVNSADAERAHSKYRYLFNERRRSLTFANTRDCALMYANGKFLGISQQYIEQCRK